MSKKKPGHVATGQDLTGGCKRAVYARAECSVEDNRAIDDYRDSMSHQFAPLLSARTRHSIFASACLDHCQSGTGWRVQVGGERLSEAARRWYFENSTVKIVDPARLSGNPTCSCQTKTC